MHALNCFRRKVYQSYHTYSIFSFAILYGYKSSSYSLVHCSCIYDRVPWQLEVIYFLKTVGVDEYINFLAAVLDTNQ